MIIINHNISEPQPEGDCTGVCVDVTPTKVAESDYGLREVFKVVFETDVLRADGQPYLVWSRSFTPSLNEKAAFRAFVKQWNGRDLAPQELAGFDTESLVGRTAKLTIVHNESGGKVYANIGLIRPDRSSTPLKPSGKYVRVKDREDKLPLARGVPEPDQVAPENQIEPDEENNPENGMKPEE